MPSQTSIPSSSSLSSQLTSCCPQCGFTQPDYLPVHEELALLERQLARLHLRRSQLLAATQRPSPIRTLPPELLLEIFRACLLPDRYHDDAVDTRRAPWSLSQVNQSWRNLVLSSPTLWSRVDLCLGHPKEQRRSLEHVITLLKLRIQRSQQIPLRLHVKIWRGTRTEHPVFKTLLQYSNRWGDAKFTASWGVMCEMLRARGNFESLQSFEWYLRGLSFSGGAIGAGAANGGVITVDPAGVAVLDDNTLAPHGFDALRIAPSLRKLTFYNVDISVGTLKAPWSQLTDLSLHYDGVDARSLLNMLSQTKVLVSFELFYRKLIAPRVHPTSSPDPALQQAIVRLRNLTQLTIPSVAKSDAPLLGFLHLPALDTISIGSLIDADLLISLLHNSSCWVTSLRVLSASIGEAKIVEVMQEMECVRTVSIKFPATRVGGPYVGVGYGGVVQDFEGERDVGLVGKCLSDALRYRWDDSSDHHHQGSSTALDRPRFPFPCLQSLELDNVWFTQNDAGEYLTQMVESRSLGPSYNVAAAAAAAASHPGSSAALAVHCPCPVSASSVRSPARLQRASVQVAPYQPLFVDEAPSQASDASMASEEPAHSTVPPTHGPGNGIGWKIGGGVSPGVLQRWNTMSAQGLAGGLKPRSC